MNGIYIHVPFCRQACRYCDFYFTVSMKYVDRYVEGVCREMNLRKEYLVGEPVNTIYFGGGTPSVLEIEQLEEIMNRIYSNFKVDEHPEITLEANPDDLSPSFLAGLKRLGFNRLSVGIQSFRAEHLKLMNRSHSAEQAFKCLSDAREAGFDNLNLDLIYGIPGLTLSQWEENLGYVMERNIPHLSAYHLTFEPGTVFDHWRKKGRISPLPEEESVAQYHLLCRIARFAQLEHYEISNFARPGLRSGHNQIYWEGGSYLGLGPAAHSFDQRSRQWNVSSLKKYLEGLDRGFGYYDHEELGSHERFHDYLITSLRMARGIDTRKVRLEFGEPIYRYMMIQATRFIDSGSLRREKGFIKINEESWFISDHVIASLMLD